MGLRRTRHALPRLPWPGAARTVHESRRRRARPPADRPARASRSTSRGTGRTTGTSCADSQRSRGSGSARSTRTSSRTTSTGSAASAIRTRPSAAGARALPRMRRDRSRDRLDDLSLWLADGTNYPGQDDLRGTLSPARGRSRSSTPRPESRLLVEYKFFEPAFYSHRPPRLGHRRARLPHARAAAQVLVDTGHHPLGDEHRADRRLLLAEGLLGGFHFNNRKYADDDLIVGSIDPFELFRIMGEIAAARPDPPRPRPAAGRVMIDQSHNVEGKIEAMIQSVVNIQTAYAKALLVDRDRLEEAQRAGDVLAPTACCSRRYETDVRRCSRSCAASSGSTPIRWRRSAPAATRSASRPSDPAPSPPGSSSTGRPGPVHRLRRRCCRLPAVRADARRGARRRRGYGDRLDGLPRRRADGARLRDLGLRPAPHERRPPGLTCVPDSGGWPLCSAGRSSARRRCGSRPSAARLPRSGVFWPGAARAAASVLRRLGGLARGRRARASSARRLRPAPGPLRTPPGSCSSRSRIASTGTRSITWRRIPATVELSASACSASSTARTSPCAQQLLELLRTSDALLARERLQPSRETPILQAAPSRADKTICSPTSARPSGSVQSRGRTGRPPSRGRTTRRRGRGRRRRGARRDGGQDERAHQKVTSRLPTTMGTSASRPSAAATRNERENAFVTARSSCS